MKITTEIKSLLFFEAGQDVKDTKKHIIDARKENEFMALLEKLYPDGMTETELNDILRFESDWIYETLGINQKQD